METKINISDILKDKPNGLRLYSPIFGECTFCCVREDTNDICVKKHNGVKEFFDSKGLYYNTGEVMLFPSKSMRDWEKFSWKKGDLLINSCGLQCIFKEWSSDDYTKFNGCYSNSRDGYEDVSNAGTAKFVKLDNNTAYGYVREIENRCGGTLNLETLEIEKTHPEFKDGDILSCDEDTYTKHTTLILHKNGCVVESLVSLIRHHDLVESREPINEVLLSRLYYAREDEKKELFDALAKGGKAWDAKKKQIVDLKLKWTPKPFDKVIVRCSKADKWSIDFFSYKVSNGYICTGDAWFGYCLPYND